MKTRNVSRAELQRRKAELLGLLEVFLQYSEESVRAELDEIRFLLGEEAG